MRILIIGGTRFIGPYLIKNLSEAGYEVHIFHRGKTQTELPSGVQEILGDRDRLMTYVSTLRELKPDLVLDMMLSNEQQAQDLMATFAGATGRVVVVSSQDVYAAFGRVNGQEGGEVDPSLITEDSPLRTKLYPRRGATPRAEDDPARSLDDYDKILVEQVIMNHAKLPGTILRLPAIYGPGDFQHRMFIYLKRMLDGRPAILVEEGVANWCWTHGYVENVVDALILAVTNEQASGRIYNVGEPFALSMTERIGQIARVADWHGRVITLPTERMPEGGRWGIVAAQNVIVDSSRIRQELGYSERIGLEEAFQRTIAWESVNPPATIDPEMFDYEAEDKALAEL